MNQFFQSWECCLSKRTILDMAQFLNQTFLLTQGVEQTALNWLKKLEESGFLIKEGSRNAPVYFLAEE